MSVRFASTNRPGRRLGWRAAGRGLIAPVLARAANDNARPDGTEAGEGFAAARRFDPMLVDALKHFAVHGLASATAARDAADEAALRGDSDDKDRWLAITSMFDRRLVRARARDLSPA